MKNNWICVYIKYELEMGLFFMCSRAGWTFSCVQRGGFFRVTNQIFLNPPPLLLNGHSLKQLAKVMMGLTEIWTI